jgi:5-methylthioribose kinase
MSSYPVLDLDRVAAVAAAFLPSPPERAEEIGDGNVNLVFRVSSREASVIVKQALPYLKIVGDSWPLTPDRARIEAEALALQGKLAPGRVPRLLAYLPELHAQVLEDLRGYEVLRRGMVAGREYPLAFRHLGIFSARTLLGTSDLLLAAAEKRALLARFHNPELCAITEDLVFTAPFTGAASNRVSEALAPYAAQLVENRALRREAARLRFVFRTRAEALVHGDLHTGSVMVTREDTRVIDAEFAYGGPIAFDVGKLLGNLALSYVAHRATGSGDYAQRVAGWAVEFWDSFAEEARRQWPAHEPWREAFFAQLLDDAARFSGAVMCRRTVGLAGVADIRDIADPAQRLRAEREAIAGGAALLLARSVPSLSDLWGLATEASAYA